MRFTLILTTALLSSTAAANTTAAEASLGSYKVDKTGEIEDVPEFRPISSKLNKPQISSKLSKPQSVTHLLNISTAAYTGEYSFAEPPRTGPQKVANYLWWFVRDLRSFVTIDGFNFFDFEQHITELRSALADVDYVVETELSYQDFASRLSFARRMFQTMVDATEKLKRYNRVNSSGHNLVFEMVELNVRALALYNPYGAPDFTIDGIERKVDFFKYHMSHSERDFANLKVVPSGMRSVFEFHGILVQKTLENLSHQFRLKGY